ncbi:Disease resistance protein RPS4 [Bienertia sinuspersici]
MFLSSHEQFVNLLGNDVRRKSSSHLIVVYGLNTIGARRDLWRDLGNLSVGTPCVVIGDFSSVLSSYDRMNGKPIYNYETQDFEAFMTNAALSEVPSSGCYYSWSNKAEVF